MVWEALTRSGLEVVERAGQFHATARRSLRRNRWAADVAVSFDVLPDGTQVSWRVDMVGTKHYELVAEIADQVPDALFDDRGLGEALQRLGRLGRVFGRKEVRHLVNLLSATEVVVEIGQGKLGDKQGVVVLTTERLFFLEKSLGSETLEEFALPAINSFSVSKKITGERLLITASGATSEITMWHGQADVMARAMRRVKHSPPEPHPAASAPPAGDDPMAQLEQLGRLRDSGVITSEQFEAKRAELLKRI